MCTFDADVSVQSGCDDGADHGEDVARSLEAVLGDTEIARVDHILALVTVHEETVEHVNEVDEYLGEPHSLFRSFSQNTLRAMMSRVP